MYLLEYLIYHLRPLQPDPPVDTQLDVPVK